MQKDRIKVLFICHGSICRSPLAEYVFKHLAMQAGVSDQFEVASAATSREEIGNDIHWGSKEVMREHGIPFGKRQARQLTKKDYEDYDYLIGMDTANIRNMQRICGGDPDGKIDKLMAFAGRGRDVADPWYTGDFDITYADVMEGCQALFNQIWEA